MNTDPTREEKKLLMKKVQNYINIKQTPAHLNYHDWEELCGIMMWYKEHHMITDKQFWWCLFFIKENPLGELLAKELR